MTDEKYTYDDFVNIIRRLRAPDGCPWDREQTHESLKMGMIEEAYEVLEGIDILSKSGDASNLCEELGDVLLQVVMHAEIASESGLFDMTDVTDRVSRKMILRHPHVFGDADPEMTSEKVLLNWEEIKRREKEGRPDPAQIFTPEERESNYEEVIRLLVKGMKKRGADPERILKKALQEL